MQFLGKSGYFVCWRPPRSWRPLLRGILYPPLLSTLKNSNINPDYLIITSNNTILFLHKCFSYLRMFYNIITPRKRSLRRLCFYTCLSFCPQRGGLPRCMLGYHPPQSRPLPPDQTHTPWEQTPPWTRHPPGSRHIPPEQCMLGDTVNERVVCILLECNLVSDTLPL